MGDTKIRIDLSQGVIEAEGSEQFVLSIYSDFKEKIQGKLKSTPGTIKEKVKKANLKTQTDNKIKKRTLTKGTVLPKLVKNLDLSGSGDKQSLKDFFQQYKANKFYEYNLIFCYYLQQIAEATPISIDHIFTCYRHIPELKTPKALSQSLFDTSRRLGWIDTSSLENITVPIAGINHIEHDMKRSESES